MELYTQCNALEIHPSFCRYQYFLPFVVDGLLKEGKAEVKVLATSEKWYGVTYKEDRALVVEALGQKVKDGIYPEKLW